VQRTPARRSRRARPDRDRQQTWVSR